MKKEKNNFSEAYVKANRSFPKRNTVILIILVILQFLLLYAVLTYRPKPQDVIKEYRVTVYPCEDGSLDIEYSFLWQALDPDEDLTWVSIGMANSNFTVYDDSVSSTVHRYRKEVEDDYVTLCLYFEKAYRAGDTLRFSFTVNQKSMLTRSGNAYFYEFVPGWFNATPVERFSFRWQASDDILYAANGVRDDNYYLWEGSFDCGGYQKMAVQYKPGTFDGQKVTSYQAFDDSGTENELEDDRFAVCFLCILGIGLIVIAEVYIVDCYVSYVRGRGFLTGYGHRVHLYGRSNPHYVRAVERHAESSSGHRSGGGCACACACACAGGGRAGCSQKDTVFAESAKKTA